jgi:hypothetical protein
LRLVGTEICLGRDARLAINVTGCQSAQIGGWVCYSAERACGHQV